MNKNTELRIDGPVDPDLSTSFALLDGYVEHDAQGRARSKFLKEGSAPEVEARKAICRVLRRSGTLNRQLREQLAALFDPDPRSWAPWQQRKIKLVPRYSGRSADHVRATQIACRVKELRQAGGSLNAAIASVSEEFSISVEMVKRIWGRLRAFL